MMKRNMLKIGTKLNHINKEKIIASRKQIEKMIWIGINKRVCKTKKRRRCLRNKASIQYLIKTHII